MTADQSIVVSATVVTEDEVHAARVMEAFARAATGLALEGMLVSVTISRGEHEEIDDV